MRWSNWRARRMTTSRSISRGNFNNPEEAVKLSLDQEVKVTHQINALVELARNENDYITINFLQWFLTEQLEEVSSMDNLLKIVQRARTICCRWMNTWRGWE